MKSIFSGLVILALAFIQINFPGRLQPVGVKPDLLLIATVFFALRRGALFGFAAGAFAGFLADCFSRSLLGLNVFLLGSAGLFVGKTGGRFKCDNYLTQMLVTFIVCLVTSTVHLLATKIAVSGPPFLPVLGRILLPGCLYSAVLAPPLFFVLSRLSKPLKL